MQIPVVIERVQGTGYRARSGEPLAFTAEAASPHEALWKLQRTIADYLAGEVELTSLEVLSNNHLRRGAGMFKDNPLFDEWQAAIAENRRKEDADLELP